MRCVVKGLMAVTDHQEEAPMIRIDRPHQDAERNKSEVETLAYFARVFFVLFLTKSTTSLVIESHLNYQTKFIKMKNKTIKTALLIFGAALFFSTNALAQSQNRQERKEPPTFAKMIEKMDANEDGKLSKDEIKGRLKEQFENIDADQDGFITEEEFENAPKPERRRNR